MKKPALAPALALVALSLFAAPALAEHHEGGAHDGAKGAEHFMKKIDADKDGKVSKAEWTAKGDTMFNESDTDKDGFITRDEAQAFRAKRMEKWKAKKAEWQAKKAAEAKTE